MKQQVIVFLKTHTSKQRQIEQLRFELEHPAQISEKELLDSLATGTRHTGAPVFQHGRISDRTMEIAMQYHDETRRLNNDTIAAIQRELRVLETDVQRLEFYISTLEEAGERVIRLYYFEGKTIEQTAQEMQITERAVNKYRDAALNDLVSMYSYLDDVKSRRRTNDDS